MDVLLRIYAGCIDGAESTANHGVDAALANGTTPPGGGRRRRARAWPEWGGCVVDWEGDVSAFVRRHVASASTSTTTYVGPVIQGNADGAQLAWNNHTVTQARAENRQIAPGFEPIAEAVSDVLRRLPELRLRDEDHQDANAVANEVLAEVVQEKPDRGLIRRGLAALYGYLATGVAAGAGAGVQEIVQKAIEHLGSLP